MKIYLKYRAIHSWCQIYTTFWQNGTSSITFLRTYCDSPITCITQTFTTKSVIWFCRAQQLRSEFHNSNTANKHPRGLHITVVTEMFHKTYQVDYEQYLWTGRRMTSPLLTPLWNKQQNNQRRFIKNYKSLLSERRELSLAVVPKLLYSRWIQKH